MGLNWDVKLNPDFILHIYIYIWISHGFQIVFNEDYALIKYIKHFEQTKILEYLIEFTNIVDLIYQFFRPIVISCVYVFSEAFLIKSVNVNKI